MINSSSLNPPRKDTIPPVYISGEGAKTKSGVSAVDALLSCSHCCTRIEGISVSYGNYQALDNVDIHLNCRELVAVIGPNGAGKTTLLRAILGEIPHKGTMRFQFQGKPSVKPRIGYVPQKLHVDDDAPISVLDFMTMGLYGSSVRRGSNLQLKAKINSSLGLVSAAHLVSKRLCELSGGEIQRVLLALALIPTPDLLLLDEPGSGVDVNGLKLFYQIVGNLRKTHDVSILLVTHDLMGIGQHADRIVLLNRSVLAQGAPQVILTDEKLIQVFGPSLWGAAGLAISAAEPNFALAAGPEKRLKKAGP
ncbi:MAG: metal ABC transporter ATP-binding protein [Candidatus Omnitrophica bacterium]|nr:metal ABC transporter ATP-binding protein [Candidatus Omnitrophota bacterium]